MSRNDNTEEATIQKRSIGRKYKYILLCKTNTAENIWSGRQMEITRQIETITIKAISQPISLNLLI